MLKEYILQNSLKNTIIIYDQHLYILLNCKPFFTSFILLFYTIFIIYICIILI